MQRKGHENQLMSEFYFCPPPPFQSKVLVFFILGKSLKFSYSGQSFLGLDNFLKFGKILRKILHSWFSIRFSLFPNISSWFFFMVKRAFLEFFRFISWIMNFFFSWIMNFFFSWIMKFQIAHTELKKLKVLKCKCYHHAVHEIQV